MHNIEFINAISMAAEADEFENFEWEEHVAKKGMWAGAVNKVTIPGLQGLFLSTSMDSKKNNNPADKKPGYQIENIYNDHTPALLKMIDEAIVNITDHEYRCRNDSNKVTEITILISSDGKITAENNGPGIPIQENAKLSKKEGRPIYIPEMAFTKMFSGSNMNKKKESVTGGINGVGAKIITANSDETYLLTIDTRVNKKYTQTFYGLGDKKTGNITFSQPKIESIGKNETSKTCISFMPSYKRLGYSKVDNLLQSNDYKDIEAWIRLRLMQSAAYMHTRVKVTFNGEHIIGSVESLAQLLLKSNPKYNSENDEKKENKKKTDKKSVDNDEDTSGEVEKNQTAILHDFMTSKESLYSSHQWKIAIVISNTITKFNHMSIVNGVVCQKGPHITFIKKNINNAVANKIKAISGDKDKKVGVRDTCNHINLVISCPIPGADWGGQRKDELQMKESEFKSYSFNEQFLEKVATIITELVLKSSPRKTKIAYEKYTAPSGKGKGNMLFAVEGDSANKMIRSGLKLKKGGIPSFEKCGIFSLQGVIMNAMKETTEYSTEVTDDDSDDDSKQVNSASIPKLLIQSERLKNNVTLQALANVLKLDYNKKYLNTNGLPFDSLVGCVDQDLDGSGKIFPLMVVFIFIFWPELIKLGFVKRFMTPLVRVFTKSGDLVKEFYYESQFKKWIAESGVVEGKDESVENSEEIKDSDANMNSDKNNSNTANTHNVNAYRIIYYKGLARHVKTDIRRMFENFDAHLYTLTIDDISKELFKVYFGNDTGPRKQALKTPVEFPNIEELQRMQESRKLSCKVVLDVDTKAYKLDDIQRKIPSVIDGLNRARRKILTGAIKRFANNNSPIKVVSFGGYVMFHLAYHQGDASLNRTIMTMAQNHTTSRQYPLLLGEGYMGSRIGATNADGVDLASARYVDVCLNSRLVKLLFPEQDKYILPYNFTDGDRVEPQWYAPILPYALMDLGQLPSEGWKYKGISVHIEDIIKTVKIMIDETDPLICKYIDKPDSKLLAELEIKYPLRLHVHGFKGKFQEIDGKTYCIGDYEHKVGDDTIYVKEIPVDISISKFISILKNEKRIKYIESIIDRSDDDIDIAVTLKSGMINTILENYGNTNFDAIEDFLKLAKSVTPNLNFVNHNGAVIEFDRSYLRVIFAWFPIRKRLYGVRLNREIIILRLKILEMEYIQKYIKEYNMSGNEIHTNKYEDEEKMSAVLTDKKYIKLDSKVIHSPGYIATEELERVATKGPGISYDYVFNLRERSKVIAAYNKNDKKLKSMQEELEQLIKHLNDKPFAGASLWKSEIDSLYEVINQGLGTEWTYKNGGKSKNSDNEIVPIKKRKTRAKKNIG